MMVFIKCGCEIPNLREKGGSAIHILQISVAYERLFYFSGVFQSQFFFRGGTNNTIFHLVWCWKANIFSVTVFECIISLSECFWNTQLIDKVGLCVHTISCR